MRQSFDIGLIIPLKDEFESAREILRFEKPDGNFYYPFSIPGSSLQGIATVLFDMGQAVSSEAATRLLTRFDVRLLALIGIAGALDPDLRLGDVVIAEAVDEYLHAAKAIPGDTGQGFEFELGSVSWRAGHDIVSYANNFEYLGNGANLAQWRERGRRRDPSLLAMMPQFAKEVPDCQVGAIATGDIVSAAAAFARWLRKHNRRLVAIEMEAGGLARVLYRQPRTDLIVVRGISDFSDERKSMLDSTATPAAGSRPWRRYAMLNAVDLFAVLVASPHFPWPDRADDEPGREDPGDTASGTATGGTAMQARADRSARVYQAGQAGAIYQADTIHVHGYHPELSAEAAAERHSASRMGEERAITGRPFRSGGGSHEASVALDELARLWEMAERQQDGRTLKELARDAGVPESTVIDWATGRTLTPADLDQLAKAGEVLASWASERPLTQRMWSQLIRSDSDRASRQKATEPGAASPGSLIGETDPMLLEIRRAIVPAGSSAESLPALTKYVPRDHDRELAAKVESVAAGHSEIAVLVGESSTGKTRACWEAVLALPPGWRLWHPFAPSWQEAALTGLPSVGPRTVIWLNEIQRYLDPPELGEQVAAALRLLLADERRGPVFLLATAWPRFWRQLTVPRQPEDPDPHPQARELLAGRNIQVPDTFARPDEISGAELAAREDPRWAFVLERAEDAEFIQYLAGAPDLLTRYLTAEPPAKALLTAAMDARRFGIGPALALPLLTDAIEGYLTSTQYRLLKGEADWLDKALAYLRHPVYGGTMPLGPAMVRRGQPPPAHEQYQLADYLEQAGRDSRAAEEPPAEFWDAACTWTADESVLSLGRAAESRGLLRHAAMLYKRAALNGNIDGANQMLSLIGAIDPAGLREAGTWAADHVTPGNSYSFRNLLSTLREADADAAVSQLTHRAASEMDPASASIGETLDILIAVKATDAIITLAQRIAVAEPPARHEGLPRLIATLQAAGETQTAELLADRLTASTNLDVIDLNGLRQLSEAGMEDLVTSALDHLVARADVTDPERARGILWGLRRAGYPDAAARLAERAAEEVRLSHAGLVGYLLRELRKYGKEAILLRRDPAASADFRASPPKTRMAAVARLVKELADAGASELATQLISRVPRQEAADLLTNMLERQCSPELVTTVVSEVAANADVTSPKEARGLLTLLRRARADDAIRAVTAKIPAQVDVGNPGETAQLIWKLHDLGEDGVAAAIAASAVKKTDACDTEGVAKLIREMAKADLAAEAQELAAKASAPDGARLDDPEALADLLAAIGDAGASDAMRVLAARAADSLDLEHIEEETLVKLLDLFHVPDLDDTVMIIFRRLLASHADQPGAIGFLAEQSHRLSAPGLLAELEAEALSAVDLTDPADAADLLTALRHAGSARLTEVAARAADEAKLDHGYAIAALLRELSEPGARPAAQILAGRIAREGPPDLLRNESVIASLRQLSADDAITALADRAIQNVKPDDLRSYLGLLEDLERIGCASQTLERLTSELPQAARSARAIAFLSDGPSDIESTTIVVSGTVSALRRRGATQALAEFADRAAGQGAFAQLQEMLPDWGKKFRYGRSPRGGPAPTWSWKDLG